MLFFYVKLRCNTAPKPAINRLQYGKKGTVSITYDDRSINQFKIAVSIMNGLKIPATFFIITDQIPGSI
jgi:peptidoglycan/xylan/chitin deacetylase (PgdA/CDA1 family)